jgi:hypothetical protein
MMDHIQQPHYLSLQRLQWCWPSSSSVRWFGKSKVKHKAMLMARKRRKRQAIETTPNWQPAIFTKPPSVESKSTPSTLTDANTSSNSKQGITPQLESVDGPSQHYVLVLCDTYNNNGTIIENDKATMRHYGENKNYLAPASSISNVASK